MCVQCDIREAQAWRWWCGGGRIPRRALALLARVRNPTTTQTQPTTDQTNHQPNQPPASNRPAILSAQRAEVETSKPESALDACVLRVLVWSLLAGCGSGWTMSSSSTVRTPPNHLRLLSRQPQLSWSYGWRLWCAALPCEAAARKHRAHLLSVHAHPFRWLITNTAVLLCPLSKPFPQAMNRFGLFPSDGLCARGRWGQRCEP